MQLLLKDAQQYYLSRVRVTHVDGTVSEEANLIKGADISALQAPRPRFVDGWDLDQLCEERAAVITDDRRRQVFDAQLNYRGGWVDQAMHKVDDDTVIVGFISAKMHVLVAQASFVGKRKDLFKGQRFPMDAYSVESYIDLGHVAGQWDDTPDTAEAAMELAHEVGLCEEAADLAYRWAAQLKEQRRYDEEGWDTVVPGPDSWYRGRDREHTSRSPLKAPKALTFEQWCEQRQAEGKPVKVRKLGRTPAYERSPFAGMRNHGTDPHRAETGE